MPEGAKAEDGGDTQALKGFLVLPSRARLDPGVFRPAFRLTRTDGAEWRSYNVRLLEHAYGPKSVILDAGNAKHTQP